jgi:hypothetical protein
VNTTQFQSYIGSLNYLALGTRPDISHAVNFLARFSSNPNQAHWNALHHLIGYIQTTKEKKLRLKPDDSHLTTWSDASWGGEYQRSTSGFIIKCFNCPIAWGSRRQKSTAKSTCGSEYIALGGAVEFTQFLLQIIRSMFPNAKCTILCDNCAAILVAEDNGPKSSLRSIEQNFFFVNDLVRKHNLDLKWVSTRDNVADFLTKPLGAQQHRHLISSLFE